MLFHMTSPFFEFNGGSCVCWSESGVQTYDLIPRIVRKCLVGSRIPCSVEKESAEESVRIAECSLANKSTRAKLTL